MPCDPILGGWRKLDFHFPVFVLNPPMRRNLELEATIVEKYTAVERFPEERGRRRWTATESRGIGYGGDAWSCDPIAARRSPGRRAAAEEAAQMCVGSGLWSRIGCLAFRWCGWDKRNYPRSWQIVCEFVVCVVRKVVTISDISAVASTPDPPSPRRSGRDRGGSIETPRPAGRHLLLRRQGGRGGVQRRRGDAGALRLAGGGRHRRRARPPAGNGDSVNRMSIFWRDRPLRAFETIVDLIGHARSTDAGLGESAELDTTRSPTRSDGGGCRDGRSVPASKRAPRRLEPRTAPSVKLES